MERFLKPSEIRKLSVAERMLIVEEIWDSIAADQELMEVTEAQKKDWIAGLPCTMQPRASASHGRKPGFPRTPNAPYRRVARSACPLRARMTRSGYFFSVGYYISLSYEG
jgi:hypothetical protein